MKLGISCSEMVLRLEDYVDRELSPTELGPVQQHLLECVTCAEQFRFEVSLVEALRDRLRRRAAPGDLLERIRRRLESDQVA